MRVVLRRIVGLVVSFVGVAAISLLSCAILAALWMALIWVGYFAATVVPAWLISTARYAVWAFALVSVATAGALILLIYGPDALLWAYKAVGVQQSKEAPAP